MGQLSTRWQGLAWIPQKGQAVSSERLPGVCIWTLTPQNPESTLPSRLSSPIYFTIKDSLPLKLVRVLAGVTDDRL